MILASVSLNCTEVLKYSNRIVKHSVSKNSPVIQTKPIVLDKLLNLELAHWQCSKVFAPSAKKSVH